MLLGLADGAGAVPALRDQWHFFCAPRGPTNKLLSGAKAKSQNASGDLDAGVATLNYACVLSAAEVKQFEAQMAKFQEQGGKGKAPALNHANSNGWIKVAAQKLDAAVKKKKSDVTANYYLGYALALQNDDWAVNRFDDATKGSADVAADANLAMAEFLFDKKGPAAAADQYKKALKAKKPIVQAYAKYKLSWIGYINGAQTKNRAAQKQAITQMAKLTKELASAKGLEQAFAQVVKDDILTLVVDYGDQAEAQKILKGVGAADVYATFLERMGYAKAQANDPTSAYKLFAAALKEQPYGPTSLTLSINMAQIAAQLSNVPLLVSNMKSLVQTYVVETAEWRKKQKPADLKKSDAQIDGLLYEYATAVDQQGRAENKPPFQTAALDLYALYLKTFPKSDKAYEVKFFDGQLLYVLKKHKEAADALYAMVNENGKGKHTKDALDLMVTAAQYAVDADKTKYTLPKPGTMKKEAKIPPVKQTYANCLDLYVKYLPKTDNTPAMRFAAGSVYYDFGHYPDGIKRYFTLMKTLPTNALSKTAAARVFEYYKAQKGDKAYDAMKEKVAQIPQLKAAPELQYYFAEQKKPAKVDKADKTDKADEDEEDVAEETKPSKSKKNKGKPKAETVSDTEDEDE